MTKTLPKEDDLGSCAECIGVSRPWRQGHLRGRYNMDFPGGSDGKESAYNVGDLDSVPGLGRSPGERKGYPLQYSGLENSTDCIVRGVASCPNAQLPSAADV